MASIIERIKALDISESRQFNSDEFGVDADIQALKDSFDQLKSDDILKFHDESMTKEEAEERAANVFVNSLMQLALQVDMSGEISKVDQKIKYWVFHFQKN